MKLMITLETFSKMYGVSFQRTLKAAMAAFGWDLYLSVKNKYLDSDHEKKLAKFMGVEIKKPELRKYVNRFQVND